MKKSKKISIYILLIISIFIFNGQHVYAGVSCSYKNGKYSCNGTVLGKAYNTSGNLVEYHAVKNDAGNIVACDNINELVSRRIDKKLSKVTIEGKDAATYFRNKYKFAKIVIQDNECDYQFYIEYYRQSGGPGKYFNISASDSAEDVKDTISGAVGVEVFSNDTNKTFKEACYIRKGKYEWDTYATGKNIIKTNLTRQECAYAKTNKKTCLKCLDISDNSYYYTNANWIDFHNNASTYYRYCTDEGTTSNKCNEDPNSTPPTIIPGGSSNCGITFMQLGCKGDYVKDFQNKLNAVQNCGLDVDGSFGNKTAQCVMSFQKDNGLESNGVADSKTIDKLNSKYTELQTKNDDANLEYHKLIFNTNGGTFANGETTRTVWYLKDENTLSPATIPGKKGYKFLGWYNGSVKYTFGNKLTSDVTLTAKYEKSTTTKICEDGDVLDIDNNQCITVQDFADQDENKFYIINNRLLTIQTKFIYTRNCSSDNKYTVTYEKTEGSNNSISCDTEKGYVRDTWRAEDTCQSDKTCPIKDGNNSCQRVYRGTCYAAYDPGDTALGTKPDSDNTYNKDIKNNATESPQTGGGIIALILVTLSIIGLSIFCYKVYNNKKEEV